MFLFFFLVVFLSLPLEAFASIYFWVTIFPEFPVSKAYSGVIGSKVCGAGMFLLLFLNGMADSIASSGLWGPKPLISFISM